MNNGFSIVPNKAIVETNNRIYPSQYLAGSVKGGVGNIIGWNYVLGTTTISNLPNGGVVTNEYKVLTNSRERVMAVHEIAFFEGSIAEDNQIGGGANVTASDYQIIGPYVSAYKLTGGELAEPYEQTIRTTIRNIAAGTITLIIVCRVKFVINRGGGAPNG